MNSEFQQRVLLLFKQGDGTIKYVLQNIGRPIGWHTVKRVLDSHGVNYSNPRSVINSQKENEIKQLLTDGLGYAKIAKQLDMKYVTVYKYCKKHDLKPKAHGRKVEGYVEDITVLAKDGNSKTEIGRKLALASKTVERISNENNIQITDKTPIPVNKEEKTKEIEDMGYKVISWGKQHNKNIVEAIHLQCGDVRKTSVWDFFKHECKRCSYTGTSKAEEELRTWIQELGLEAVKVRLGSKEIDIYIPSLKVGIEYCGVYWHSERFDLDKKRHYNKMKLAEENGIRLITIFEDEWTDRQDQVKNFLKSVLGVHNTRVYARKCEIKEVSGIQARSFLDEHHIQGKTTVKIAFGLFYDGELLGLVTGNQHHRQGHDSILVLNRLVFRDGAQVVGGASKLLKRLVKYGKEHGYQQLISWSDNRISQGNVYEKCGFSLVEELSPDYSYSMGGSTRISKQSCKKKNLLQKGASGDMSMTERELALTLNYYRIWDCGKKRWNISLKGEG